jgi:hypothetical protein
LPAVAAGKNNWDQHGEQDGRQVCANSDRQNMPGLNFKTAVTGLCYLTFDWWHEPVSLEAVSKS